MSKYKNQHFLPRFYLENFAFDYKANGNSSRCIYYLKKDNREIKHKGIDNICTESYYYSIKDDSGDYDHALEKFLSKLESQARPVIQKILQLPELKNSKSKSLLKESDRVFLAGFIFWAHLRSPYILENTKDSLSDAFDEIKRKYPLVEKSEEENKEEVKKYALDIVARLNESDDFLNVLLDKKWYIIEAPQKAGFAISDNPVTLLHKGNRIDHPKAEIHFPLSHNLLLVLLDKGYSYSEFIPKGDRKIITETNQWVAKQAYSLLLSKDKYLLEHLNRKPKFGIFNPGKPVGRKI